MPRAGEVMANIVYGIDEVIKLFDEIEKVTTVTLTRAARAGSKIVVTDARANAPKDEGDLKRGIKSKLEKSKTKGKKVFSIGFYGKDGKGSEFVKISKEGKRSFYPVSQEYGWVDKSGKRHPGKRFLRNAIDNNREIVNQTVMQTLGEGLDKLR